MRQLTPSQAFGERMRAARISAGLSQAELSERLALLEVTLKRQAIIEIEKRTRRVTLDEAFAISAALGVAPINLFVPFESEKVLSDDAAEAGVFKAEVELKIGQRLSLHPMEARAWIRGTALYAAAPFEHWHRFFCVEIPPPNRYRLRQVAAYVRTHAERLGRWKLPPMEPLPEERTPELSVPGFTPPENSQGFPAPLWTMLMYEPDEEPHRL